MMKLMRLVGNNFYWTKGGGGWSPDGVVFSDIEQIKPMENVPADLATTSTGYSIYIFICNGTRNVPSEVSALFKCLLSPI